MSVIQLIKCSEYVEPTTATERILDGIRGIIQYGSNPYRVRGGMQVRATPIMGTPGNQIFLFQLFKDGVVIACGHGTI